MKLFFVLLNFLFKLLVKEEFSITKVNLFRYKLCLNQFFVEKIYSWFVKICKLSSKLNLERNKIFFEM